MLLAPTGVLPMTNAGRKRNVFAIFIATLAGIAALLAVALAYPQTVSDPTLGGDWQCRRVMFLTTCARIKQVTPTAQNSPRRICPQRV
jgi:hypothetical protein